MASTINSTDTGSGGLITTGDSSDELQLQTAETTAITITSGQQSAFIAGTASAPAVTTTGDLNTGIYFPAADNIGFTTGGTIRGRWTTDGLCFGSDTAAANALDDYEEGTWTPGLTFGGGSTGITFNSRVGYYTKIGNVVYYYCSITLTNKGSSSGDALVTGLPFTANSATALFSTGNLRGVTALTVTAPSYATATRAATTINLLDNNAGSQQTITNADFANNTEFNVTGFYYV